MKNLIYSISETCQFNKKVGEFVLSNLKQLCEGDTITLNTKQCKVEVNVNWLATSERHEVILDILVERIVQCDCGKSIPFDESYNEEGVDMCYACYSKYIMKEYGQ